MMSKSLQVFTHMPPPTHAPTRDPACHSEVERLSRISRSMGKPPQPWQRLTWDLGTQYRIETGRKVYKYTDVLVSTPRQSGKTTLLRPLRISRMIDNDAAHLFSTAQSQKHSSKRMLDMVNETDRSLLGPLFKMRRGKGDTGMELLSNAADLSQFTPNEEALHGETPPYVDWDEIWTQTKEEGDAILGGVRPAMATLFGTAQRWYTSTKGTLESTFMNSMIEESLAGERPRLCYISWELPEGMDPYDPASWWQFHPALGNTLTEEALKSETDLPANDWLRGYCNRLTESESSFMPLEDWDLLKVDLVDLDRPDIDQVTVGFEIAPSNESANIIAAWLTPEGNPAIIILHAAQGTAWVVDYLNDLHATGFRRFMADGKGPTSRIVEALPEGFPIESLTYPQRLLADQVLIAAMRDDQTLIQDGSKTLRMQVANAVSRKHNGQKILDRDKSTQPIPGLIAASVAIYGAMHPPAPAPVPLIVS